MKDKLKYFLQKHINTTKYILVFILGILFSFIILKSIETRYIAKVKHVQDFQMVYLPGLRLGATGSYMYYDSMITAVSLDCIIPDKQCTMYDAYLSDIFSKNSVLFGTGSYYVLDIIHLDNTRLVAKYEDNLIEMIYDFDLIKESVYFTKTFKKDMSVIKSNLKNNNINKI